MEPDRSAPHDLHMLRVVPDQPTTSWIPIRDVAVDGGSPFALSSFLMGDSGLIE
jgi:hypothetical protein